MSFLNRQFALGITVALSALLIGGCGGSQSSGLNQEEAAQINHEPRPGGPPPEAKAYMEKSNKSTSPAGAPAGAAAPAASVP